MCYMREMRSRKTMTRPLMMAIFLAIVCMVSSQAWAHADHSASPTSVQRMSVAEPTTAAVSITEEVRSYQHAIERHSHLLGDADCGGVNCCGSCSSCIHAFSVDPYISEPVLRTVRLSLIQSAPVVGINPDDLNRPPQSLA